jgi:predicted transcriptional regulator
MRNSPKITRRGFRPGSRGAGLVLGELQTAVMEILWQESGLTVNEVEERLRKKRALAHTTVLTTLDRMHASGYLLREKQGKAFVYSPRYTRDEFERGMVQEVLGALLGQLTGPAISAFVDLVGDDAEALDRLEQVIREKRREKGRRGK